MKPGAIVLIALIVGLLLGNYGTLHTTQCRVGHTIDALLQELNR